MGAFVWKRTADSSSSATAHAAPPPAHALQQQQHTGSNGVTAATLIPPPCPRQQPAKLPSGHSHHPQQNGQPSLKRKENVLHLQEEQHPIQPGLEQHNCPHQNHPCKRQRTFQGPGPNSTCAPNAPPSLGSQQHRGAPHSQPPPSAQPGQPPPAHMQCSSQPHPSSQQLHRPRHQPHGPPPQTSAHRSSSQQQQRPGASSPPLQETHKEDQGSLQAGLHVPTTCHSANRPLQAQSAPQGTPPRQPHARPTDQGPPQRQPHAHPPNQGFPPRQPQTHPPHQGPPHRQPRVQPQWSSPHNPAAPGPHGTAAQHKRGHTSESIPRGDAGAALAMRQAELEALRRRLHMHEKQVAQQQAQRAAMEAAKEAARLQRQADIQKRKAQLEKGFRSMAPSSATGDAASQPSAATTAPKIAVAIADELELERISDCKSDLECLKLTPGASVEQVRRSFKGLAMAVHPDKCSLPGAAEAFQRLSAAYNRLNKQSG